MLAPLPLVAFLERRGTELLVASELVKELLTPGTPLSTDRLTSSVVYTVIGELPHSNSVEVSQARCPCTIPGCMGEMDCMSCHWLLQPGQHQVPTW